MEIDEEILSQSFQNMMNNFSNAIKRSLVMIDGTVVAGSVDLTAYTCDVKLKGTTTDVVMHSVPLRVLLNDQSSFIEIPNDGTGSESKVLLTFRDGNINRPQILEVHTCKQIVMLIGKSKVDIIDGTITFNDGNFGGLTKTLELQTQLNKTNALLNAFLGVINGSVIPTGTVGGPDTLQAALKLAMGGQQVGDYSSIEDKTIKH